MGDLAAIPIDSGSERLLIPFAVAYGVAVSACLIKIRMKEMKESLASRDDSAWLAPSPLVIVLMVSLATLLFVLAAWQRSASGVRQRQGAERRSDRQKRAV